MTSSTDEAFPTTPYGTSRKGGIFTATNREIAIKWSTYSLAALALLFFHSLLFGQVRLLGVVPFLPPLLVAVLASFEAPWPSALFGLVFGALCDLALPVPFPFLFTLAFTLSALAATLIAKYAIQPGFFCSLAATAATFAIVHIFFCAAYALQGTALRTAIFLALRETAVSSAWLVVYYPIFRALRNLFDF